MVLQGRAKLGTNVRRLFWEASESGNAETGGDGTVTLLREQQGRAGRAAGPPERAYQVVGQVSRSGAGSSPM
jgi:hypothetical protein